MHNTFSHILTSLRRYAAIRLTTTVIAVVGSLAFSVPTAKAEIYQFIGRDGSISLTNVPSDSRYQKIEIESSQFHATLSEQELEPVIRRHSSQQQLHPALIRAVIKAESGFDPRAVSRAGAIGLMQLMPQTARQLNVTNPFDPAQNVDAGVRHLKKLLQDFGGNVKLSLAAYNAGEGAVHRSSGIPNYAETKNYVKRISALYANGDGPQLRALSSPRYEALRYEPVRVSRDSQGVLTFTNTD